MDIYPIELVAFELRQMSAIGYRNDGFVYNIRNVNGEYVLVFFDTSTKICFRIDIAHGRYFAESNRTLWNVVSIAPENKNVRYYGYAYLENDFTTLMVTTNCNGQVYKVHGTFNDYDIPELRMKQ